MPAARTRLAAVAVAAAALGGLTACEQPTPLVTLYSGDTSIDDRAFSYCFDGQDPAKEPGTDGACRFDTHDGRAPRVLQVEPGDEVLVDVDKELADSGWYVVLRGKDGQQSRLATQDSHTTSFLPDFGQSEVITVEVQQLQSTAPGARAVGVWQFAVVPS